MGKVEGWVFVFGCVGVGVGVLVWWERRRRGGGGERDSGECGVCVGVCACEWEEEERGVCGC